MLWLVVMVVMVVMIVEVIMVLVVYNDGGCGSEDGCGVMVIDGGRRYVSISNNVGSGSNIGI